MNRTNITLVLIPTALYLLLVSTTYSHALGAFHYDISKWCGYDVSVLEAAVLSGTRRVNYNSTNNWCNITFDFPSSWSTTDGNVTTLVLANTTRFTFRIDSLLTYYYPIDLELTQYGERCSLNSSKLMSYRYSNISKGSTRNFNTSVDCKQKLSIYQTNAISRAYYKIQIIITPHIDCNYNESSSSIYPYKCSSSGECIAYPLYCDGLKNCISGTDEYSTCKMTTLRVSSSAQPASTWTAPPSENSGLSFWIYCIPIFLILVLILGCLFIRGGENGEEDALCKPSKWCKRKRTPSPMRTSPQRRNSPPRMVSSTPTQQTVAEMDSIHLSSTSEFVTVDPSAPPAYENVAMDTLENRLPLEGLSLPTYEQYSKQLY